MIFGGKNPGSSVMPGIFVLIVGREYGNGRGFGIGWQKPMCMHDCTKRNVAKICRSIVVTNYAVGKKGERVGVVAIKFPRSLNADTSPPIGVIHEDKFAPVGVGFFYRWKFSCLRTEDFRFRFFANGGCMKDESANKYRQKPSKKGITGNEE